LEQVEDHKAMLICDAAGMGTVLTHLSKQIKQDFPKWVVKIDLNVHADTLKALNAK
jgi:hypothetical protein